MRLTSRLVRTTGWAVLGCLVVAGCGSGGTTAGSPADTTTALAVSVDIGGGRTMYLECRGSGSPTVVLISGAGNAADQWSYVGSATDDAKAATLKDSAVYPKVARFTTVCAYDRPGTKQWDDTAGRSSPVPQPTTTQGGAADLHALLTAAAITGPYVLVGHSLGGMIATTYARTYPNDVTGLVLVDSFSQYVQSAWPPAAWTQLMEFAAGSVQMDPSAEAPDYPSSIVALEATAPLPTMPVTVLTADKPWDVGGSPAGTYWPEWLEAQNLLATALSATHITETDSGHAINIQNPSLVVDQICAVITPARDC